MLGLLVSQAFFTRIYTTNFIRRRLWVCNRISISLSSHLSVSALYEPNISLKVALKG